MPIDEHSHFFSNGAVRIHYHLYGQGPALVLVHGHPDNEMTFSMQIEEFSKDHTLILPTLRGYPPSDVPLDPEAYDGGVMASDLVALLDHLKIEKAVFAGGDVGGITVQKLAFLHPERLSGLVIFNTPILGTMMHLIHHDPEQQELSKYSLKYIKHNPGDAYDLDFVCRTITDPGYRAEIKEYLQKSPEGGMFYFFRKNFPAPPYGQNIDTSGMHYKMPCVVIWGMQEPYFSDKMLDGFYKWFDQSVRVVVLPQAGHWPWREDARKVNYELRSWLNALESGQL
ncbi:epoxide hydrolase-like protein [Trichoderma sp. SZMC 28014]